MYLINGNFCYNIQYILYIVSCSCTTSCIDNLSKTNCFVFSRKRVQNYCFFAIWPNFLEDFLNYLRNSLIFSTHFLSSHPHLFQHLTEHTPVFRESGCTNTAFPRHNQLFMQTFYIFFITHWLSKFMLYNINFGNDIHVEPAIQNYPISQLRDFLKLQRLSEGWAKDERRASEGRAVVNTTKMCIRNNCIAKN